MLCYHILTREGEAVPGSTEKVKGVTYGMAEDFDWRERTTEEQSW